jgi:cbb3-type cytochrome c oxidase subunit III
MKTLVRIRHAAVLVAALGAFSASFPALAGDGKVELGKTTFNTFCVACHQPEGVGKPGVAPSLTSPEFLASASDDFLRTTISNGRPGTAMVAWKPVLGEQKIDAVIAYLRSFAKQPSKVQQVDSEPPAKGDISLGKARFAEICKGCHAEKGAGYAAGGSAPAIGKPGFLNVASDGYIREMVMHGRSNTRMRGFSGSTGLANLSKKEIDSIISYLRTLNH